MTHAEKRKAKGKERKSGDLNTIIITHTSHLRGWRHAQDMGSEVGQDFPSHDRN